MHSIKKKKLKKKFKKFSIFLFSLVNKFCGLMNQLWQMVTNVVEYYQQYNVRLFKYIYIYFLYTPSFLTIGTHPLQKDGPYSFVIFF